MGIFHNLSVAYALFLTDMKLFRKVALDKLINMVIWMFCVLGVNAYLLPKFGVTSSFGLISLAGFFAVAGIFQGFSDTIGFVLDVESTKIIKYYGMLPIPTWMMLLRHIISNAFTYFVYTIALIPFSKLLVWNLFDLSAVNWGGFMLICVLSSLFYGALTLYAPSLIKSSQHIGNLWTRVIFPLWFLGGFSFSWRVLYQVSPTFAYINLCNPVMYITEAYRSVVVGSADYLNFWLCCGVVVMFTLVLSYLSVRVWKQRLDFV